MAQLTVFQQSPGRRQAIIWANGGLAYWRMYASLGLNETNKRCQ